MILPKLSHFTLIFACAMFWVFGFGRDDRRKTEQRLQYENTAGRAAVVSENLQFRSDRVSRTCVVRYQSKDTAETVTLYIDTCVAMFWVFGFGRMLACWFRPVSFAQKYRICNFSYRFAVSRDSCAKSIGSLFITLYSELQ